MLYTALCSAVKASHVLTLQRVNIGSTGSIICMGKTDVLRCQVVTDSESLRGRGCVSNMLIKMYHTVQVFVLVHVKDKLIGCASPAQVSNVFV